MEALSLDTISSLSALRLSLSVRCPGEMVSSPELSEEWGAHRTKLSRCIAAHTLTMSTFGPYLATLVGNLNIKRINSGTTTWHRRNFNTSPLTGESVLYKRENILAHI
jgi:hypothetical protein